MQETLTWNIQPYDDTRDAAQAYALWQTTAGQFWPLDFQRWQQILKAPGAGHSVARQGDQLIGLVATSLDQQHADAKGYLLLLLVAPAWPRRGLGSALHRHALDHLRAAGAGRISLGGHTPRFWCGVPENLPEAVAFFQRHGWQAQETVYDLLQDLRAYTTPPALLQRVADQQITLLPATPADMAEVLAFEAREFPGWLPHYQKLADLGDYQDILLARAENGEVAGVLLTSTAQSHPSRTDVIWRPLFGPQAGSIGAVGVAPHQQGRGIGIALVARASELLLARGVQNCTIDWVVLTDFYARLGYKKWRGFIMSEMALPGEDQQI